MSWDQKSPEEKIAFLKSERADLLHQKRRSVHTSRDDGISKRMNKIDAQIAELEQP